MKNLPLAMLLAAFSLTAFLVIRALSDDESDPRSGRPNAAAEAPDRVPVLSVSGDGLEVLLRPRFVDARRLRFTDRTFAERLGITVGDWTFLEAIVVNLGEEPIPDVDPSTIELELDGGRVFPARDLRDLAAETPDARVLVDAFTVAEGTPLPAGRTRRVVVAVPRHVVFGRVSKASWLGVELRPAVAGRRALERWLGRPELRFLEAVLESEEGEDRG